MNAIYTCRDPRGFQFRTLLTLAAHPRLSRRPADRAIVPATGIGSGSRVLARLVLTSGNSRVLARLVLAARVLAPLVVLATRIDSLSRPRRVLTSRVLTSRVLASRVLTSSLRVLGGVLTRVVLGRKVLIALLSSRHLALVILSTGGKLVSYLRAAGLLVAPRLACGSCDVRGRSTLRYASKLNMGDGSAVRMEELTLAFR